MLTWTDEVKLAPADSIGTEKSGIYGEFPQRIDSVSPGHVLGMRKEVEFGGLGRLIAEDKQVLYYGLE
jgi:hypothetical protein